MSTATVEATSDALQTEYAFVLPRGLLDVARKNGSFVLYDYAGGETGRWYLTNCWPSKVAINGMQAGSSDVLVEEMTLVHEGLEPA